MEGILSIYLLQDTHFDKNIENFIKAEWGYDCYFASFGSTARGVAILLNNNFEFKVNRVYRDVTTSCYLLIQWRMSFGLCVCMGQIGMTLCSIVN